MVTVPPVALGYIAGSDEATRVQQRAAVVRAAHLKGYALAQILTDPQDVFTMSQVVAEARRYNAQLVVLPAAAVLAATEKRLHRALADLHATCLLVGASASRPATPRLADIRGDAPMPRHLARTES